MNVEHAIHVLRGWLDSFEHRWAPPPEPKPVAEIPTTFARKPSTSIPPMVGDSWIARVAQPSSVFTIACISVSVLALASAWRVQSLDKRKEDIAPQFAIEASPARGSTKIPISPPRRPRDYHAKIATLLTVTGKQIQICRDLESRDVSEISALAEELPSTINSLCHVQQLLSLYHGTFDARQGLKAVFEAVLSGCLDIASHIDLELINAKNGNPDQSSIEHLTQQLREQRESLIFVIDSISRRNTNASSSIPPSLEASTIVGEALPNAEDIKQLIEHPPPPEDELPKYTLSTEASSDTLEAIINHIGPVEIDSMPLDLKNTVTVAMIIAAVSANDTEELESLLRAMDANATHGRLKRTALHQASRLNRAQCARILVNNGALVDQEDVKGDGPIHLACWEGHVEVLKILIDSGANIDALSGRDGNSPLFCAISSKNIDAARLLLKNGARVNLRSPGEMTALHQAAITGQSAVCELLLERGANVDSSDSEENTPLHYAATNGDVRTARVLLAAKADINARQETGLTPLHWAALKGNDDLLRHLLDEEADVDAESDTSATPLHCAAAQGNIGCVKILLRYEANPHIETLDWDGMNGTPESIASQTKHAAIARLIKRHADGRSQTQ